MPHVNGTFYRSAGQGYSAEKSKMSSGKPGGTHGEVSHADENAKAAGGSKMMVEHMGGGRFRTKTGKGDQGQEHDSLEALHSHMAQHFGVDQPEGEPDSDDEATEQDGGNALNMILG
jgi:hypothetical protein